MTNMRLTHYAVLASFGLSFLCGCGRYGEGYFVDRSKKQVIWRTVDEGYGVREKVVTGADVDTFVILDFERDYYFKKDSFAKDKNHVYFVGGIIKGALPNSFRYEDQVYRDDKNIYVFDSSLGFIPKEPDSAASKSSAATLEGH